MNRSFETKHFQLISGVRWTYDINFSGIKHITKIHISKGKYESNVHQICVYTLPETRQWHVHRSGNKLGVAEYPVYAGHRVFQSFGTQYPSEWIFWVLSIPVIWYQIAFSCLCVRLFQLYDVYRQVCINSISVLISPNWWIDTLQLFICSVHLNPVCVL